MRNDYIKIETGTNTAQFWQTLETKVANQIFFRDYDIEPFHNRSDNFGDIVICNSTCSFQEFPREIQ